MLLCNDKRQSIEPLALALLRITVGVIMAVHGWEKLNAIPQMTEAFTAMGLPAPKMMVYLAISGEFLGGLGLIVGLLTPIAAFGVFATMAVAVFKVHWANGLMAKNNGFEYPMTLMFVALYFMVRGAGPLSLDGLCCRKKKSAA